MKLQRIHVGEDFCEPSYFTVHGNVIYIALHKNKPCSPLTQNGEFVAVDISAGHIIWRFPLAGDQTLKNEINAAPIVFENTLLIASGFGWYCLEAQTGAVRWSKSFKEKSANALSLVDGVIYCSRANEMQSLDPHTGKLLTKRKHRVKWLDSAVQHYRGRFFAATGNSKIIEVAPPKWDIVNEYKYSGGWAIAATPYFYESIMISSSYASEIIAFNLETTQPEWKVKKKAGSKPYQAFREGSALFYDGHTDSRLHRLEITPKKKVWVRELERLQALSIRNEDEFLAVYKSGNHTFNLGRFDFRKGKFLEHLTPYEAPDWQDYHYDLWEGISIYEDDNYIVTNFKPNEIIVMTK